MKSPTSRSYRLDDDPRDIARDAARRAGMSLDDWLVEAICEKAERALHDDPDEDHEGERLDSILRRLERDREQARGTSTVERRDGGKADADRARSKGFLGRRRGQTEFSEDDAQSPAAIAASQRQTARALKDLVELLEGKLSRLDLQATEAAMEQRIMESERKITKALAGLADLMDDRWRDNAPASPGFGGEILEQLGRLKRRPA